MPLITESKDDKLPALKPPGAKDMAKQTHYQVTAQTSAEDWVKRHLGRIPRLEQAISESKDKAFKKAAQAELDMRLEHLAELQSSLTASLEALNKGMVK